MKQQQTMKTKTIRAKLEDAKTIEQVARELAAELQQVVKVSDVVEEMTRKIEDAKERIKKRISKAS